MNSIRISETRTGYYKHFNENKHNKLDQRDLNNCNFNETEQSLTSVFKN